MTHKESLFGKFFDWAIDHYMVLSAIFLAAVIGWQAYSGMYDWRAVATRDLLQDQKAWIGRDVVLSNVSIKKFDIREEGTDTFITLWLVNGLTTPPDTEKPMLVLARMPTANAKKFESLPWHLSYGTTRLTQARVIIQQDFAVLREYWLPSDLSWFSAPYWLTVNIVNRFASLQISEACANKSSLKSVR
jgi:hypothetical protein